MLRRALAPLAALVALLLSFGLVAAPASAHDALIASTPADGETLTTAPTELTLTYSAEIAQIGADVVVTDPAGTVVSQPLTVAGTDVVVPLAADLAPGAYAIAWRVTSSDGHPIDGTLAFTLDVPVASPTAEPTSAEPSATESASESAASESPSTSASETATEVESESASAEATETETAPAEDGAASNLPTWVIVVVALAVVGGIVGLIVRMRRDRNAGQGPHNR